MIDYQITCCSTADMPAEYFEERHIPFACFHFQLNGREYPDDLGKSITFDDFYKQVADGAMPKTSQVNVEQYIALFEPILQKGKDILHISLSSGISGAVNSARIARDELQKKYPERKIYVIDSLGASSGYGMLVDAAWELQCAGESIDEVYQWIEENKLKVNHWFFSTDLTHYRRGGRIPAASAAIGTLLNICPLMNMNAKGELKIQKKVRGKKRVMQEILDTMVQHAQRGTEYADNCFISNSACYGDAQKLAGLIQQRFLGLRDGILINSVGTVIGSHTGPGTVALFFWGSKRMD